MKRTILVFVLIFSFFKLNAQVIFDENFDNFGILVLNGWTIQNLSEPVGTSSWGTTTHFPSYTGSSGSFAAVNYQSTGNVGTISNWLITPVIYLKNGDIISFYSITDHGIYPDRLEMRLSLNGFASTVPSSTSGSLGDFTTLALTINPNLIVSGYPTSWTNYSYLVTGLTQPTNCRIGFRYFVTNAGSNAANGDLIGIDSLTVTTSSLSNPYFDAKRITIFPNPVCNYLTIENLEANMQVEFFDFVGKSINAKITNNNSFDVSSLAKG